MSDILTFAYGLAGNTTLAATAMQAQELEHMITFSASARVLALCVAGSKALPFEEMLKYRSAENFYAQGSLLAGCCPFL